MSTVGHALIVVSPSADPDLGVLRRAAESDYLRARKVDARLPAWDASMLVYGPTTHACDESGLPVRGQFLHAIGWKVDLS